MNYEKVQATNLPTVPEQPVGNKVGGIYNVTSDLTQLVEGIKTKLFGAKPCNVTTGKEPESINDVLDLIRTRLDEVYNTLSDINCKL